VFTDMVNSRCFILMKNRVRPDSQLFNSWGCNSWGKGWGVLLPSRLGSLRERRKLSQRGPGRSPGRKTSFGEFTAWKNTPDFTSPDFFHFPWLFPDHFGIPWLFQVFQVSGHPAFYALSNTSIITQWRNKQTLMTKTWRIIDLTSGSGIPW